MAAPGRGANGEPRVAVLDGQQEARRGREVLALAARRAVLVSEGVTAEGAAARAAPYGDGDEEHADGTGLKYASVFIIFVLGLLGGCVPAVLRSSFARYDAYMSVMNCFSGGVFVATCLLHLLPEALEGAEGLDYGNFPLPYAIVGLGFYLVLFVERVMFHTHGHATSQDCDHGGQPGASPAEEVELRTAFAGHFHSHSDAHDHLDEVDEHKDSGVAEVVAAREGVGWGQMRGSMLLLLAISIHSVLAGVALGLADDLAGVRSMLVAICAHKSAAAIAVGTRVLRDGASMRQLAILICVFALMTPVGILVGAIVGSGDSWANMVLNCLAAGTFLYVGMAEVVGDELETRRVAGTHVHGHDSRGMRVGKFGAMMFGMLVISLAALAEEEHGP